MYFFIAVERLNTLYCRYTVMPYKLTVYIDDSIRQLLSEARGTESISKLVSEAIESYVSSAQAKDLTVPGGEEENQDFPSLSEVERMRPSARGSSASIITRQRRSRNASISR
jgi:hypothetical protein